MSPCARRTLLNRFIGRSPGIYPLTGPTTSSTFASFKAAQTASPLFAVAVHLTAPRRMAGCEAVKQHPIEDSLSAQNFQRVLFSIELPWFALPTRPVHPSTYLFHDISA